MAYEFYENLIYFVLFGSVVAFIAHYVLGLTFQRRKITPYNRRIFSKFEPRSSVMNRSELTLYRALIKQLGSKFLILPMVRIEDVITVKTIVRNQHDRQSLRGRIKSRHFDFVICDKNGTPLGVVELDGPTHRKKNQKAIDQFKDGLVEAVGLKMYRIIVGQDYYKAIRLFDLA